MLKVGLTGGIGSGKSTVSNLFLQHNIPVIDADIISREIFNIYPEAKTEIRHQFGENIFDEQGNLKRRELGNLVFKCTSLRKKLEDITLPFIIKEIFKRIEEYNKAGEKICVIDAPTLIEVKLHTDMDVNIVVWVDLQTQISRVFTRDKLSNEEILNRIKAQMPLDEKKSYANFIIDNRGNFESTKEQFEVVLNKLYEFEVTI